MPAEKVHDEMSSEGAFARMETDWQRIRAQLERERDRIHEEIKSYPPPIPACDAQFNYLLEERARIAQALGRLEALSKETPT